MGNLDCFMSLLGCQSVEGLHASTGCLARSMGFDHFLYGIRVNTSLIRPYQFVFSGYPEKWWQYYNVSGYQVYDPIVRHCVSHVTPIVWNKWVFAPGGETRIMNEAREFGLASGISFPIRGSGCEYGLLSLASERDQRLAQRDIMENVGRAHLLTCYLHEAVVKLALKKDYAPQKVDLTLREKECLLWAAEGKTSWEIANIIKTSERTVVFHLQNAARKMGVTNRRHAVAKALVMGLVSP